MAPAWTALANITLGSAASSVTFSSISGLYKDLHLVITGKGSSSPGVYIRFNSDSGSNYANIWATGYAGSMYSGSNTTTQIYGNYNLPMDTTVTSIVTTDVLDYSATNKHKSTLTRFSGAAYGVEMLAGRWINTAAITSLSITASSGTFAAGSTFALYGVSA